MRGYIRKIQRKPKPVRDRIALGVALGFTGMIFLAWIYQSSYTFSNIYTARDSVKSVPISEISTAANETFHDMNSFFDEIADHESAESRMIVASSSSSTQASESPPLSASSTGLTVRDASATTSTSTASSTSDSPRMVRIITTSTASSSSQ